MDRCGLCRFLDCARALYEETSLVIVECPLCGRALCCLRDHRAAVSCNEAVHMVIVAYRFFRGQSRSFRVDLERHDWGDHYCFHCEG